MEKKSEKVWDRIFTGRDWVFGRVGREGANGGANPLTAARTLQHAQVLLKANEVEGGPAGRTSGSPKLTACRSAAWNESVNAVWKKDWKRL